MEINKLNNKKSEKINLLNKLQSEYQQLTIKQGEILKEMIDLGGQIKLLDELIKDTTTPEETKPN